MVSTVGRSRCYTFRTSGGDSLIPVANGTFETPRMSADFALGNCFLQFYDTDGVTPVTPTAGTATFEAGVYEGQWLEASNDSEIQATAVIAGPATYTPPTFDSQVQYTRMTLDSVTGASFVRACHWRVIS